MRILKHNSLLKLVNSYLIDAPQPTNISYHWNYGSLLLLCLAFQIITGVTLAMHYNPSVAEAFNSLEHIMRDVNNGWLVRYLHSNTASAFFFLVYLHIGKGIYYGSYKSPRTTTWVIGAIILVMMMAIGFLGYVLPYGQMSLWGATVITNLISAIPWIGQDIVEFIWGGFSVNNATLNRFFSLHFVLPFALVALVLMHLIALHDTAGSSNPLGISSNYDRIPFAPYYLFKDLITIFVFFFVLSNFVFFAPNMLGDSDNYIMANPMQTPAAIVPEWYLLPFYAILRSIPNKLLGVIAMFGAIFIITVLPITNMSKLRNLQFRPLSRNFFFIFVANFVILMVLGAKHVESPYVEFGQISTVLYFSYFILIVPAITLFENIFSNLDTKSKNLMANNNTNNIVLESNLFNFNVKFIVEKLMSILIVYAIIGIFYLFSVEICHLDDTESESDNDTKDAASINRSIDKIDQKIEKEKETLETLKEELYNNEPEFDETWEYILDKTEHQIDTYEEDKEEYQNKDLSNATPEESRKQALIQKEWAQETLNVVKKGNEQLRNIRDQNS